jgi:beta-phosphoglucomutase-like phosphatase (HAD superfamily)
MLRAVLFDLDGTLVDTERESATALERVLARHGVTMTPADFDYNIGHSWLQIHEFLTRGHGAAVPPLRELIEATAAEREATFAASPVTALPGGHSLPERLAARMPVAIVSGSCRREADAAIAGAGLQRSWFRLILTAEDYAPGKPDPRGYLLAAERLGVAPRDCLVVEDSAPGVLAGRAAGMRVVAVRAGNFAGQDQSPADVIVDTLDQIDDPLLARLFD